MIGPPAHTPRHGVSPRLTRRGPNSSPSRSRSAGSIAYNSRPRRSGEQNPPTQTRTWREYGSMTAVGRDIASMVRNIGLAMAETLLVGGLTVVADRSGPATHSPVLFIPGYFADAFVFDRWLPFFAARGFPAFAVNLRGRAGSSREIDVGRVRVGEYVEDALRIARWIGRPLV